jgi:hypothetical protein
VKGKEKLEMSIEESKKSIGLWMWIERKRKEEWREWREYRKWRMWMIEWFLEETFFNTPCNFATLLLPFAFAPTSGYYVLILSLSLTEFRLFFLTFYFIFNIVIYLFIYL